MQTQTTSQLIETRIKKHEYSKSLLSKIEGLQNAIVDHQMQINKMNPKASYYQTLAQVHLNQIEKLVDVRNAAIREYENVGWQLYRAALPVFGTTAVQEISATLYEPSIN